MERRHFLATCAGLGFLSVSGCSSVEEGDDTPEADDTGGENTATSDDRHSEAEEIEGVLTELRSVVGKEDPEGFRELVHSDAPVRDDEWEDLPFEEWEIVDHLMFAVAERIVLDLTDSEARVCERPNVAGVAVVFELRVEEGEWVLWDYEQVETELVSPDPEAFDECGRLVIRLHEVPEQARVEVETALEDGVYETDDELLLPHLLDVDESYLAIEEENGRTEYQAHVDASGTVLELEETIPSWGEDPLAFENDSEETVTVDVTVVRDRTDETVVDESLTIEPGAEADTEPFDRQFGSYTASIETADIDEEFGWSDGESELPWRGFYIREAVLGIKPGAMLELEDCRGIWRRSDGVREECGQPE